MGHTAIGATCPAGLWCTNALESIDLVEGNKFEGGEEFVIACRLFTEICFWWVPIRVFDSMGRGKALSKCLSCDLRVCYAWVTENHP